MAREPAKRPQNNWPAILAIWPDTKTPLGHRYSIFGLAFLWWLDIDFGAMQDEVYPFLSECGPVSVKTY